MNRHEWMVGLIDVRPGDIILEIGCGSGIVVSLICGKLEDSYCDFRTISIGAVPRFP